ncbi:MAG: hypothetical protein II969_04485 [Anaerolineaceae bacterium]|nr:hypothetical protein [Anaerolineaceae bacterium]
MEKKNLFAFFVILLFAVLVMSACSTRTSDSGYSLKTVGKRIDSNIYVLNVTMLGDPKSNKNIGGEGVARQYSDIYGFGNSRLWQDGKGLVAVRVNSVSPALDYVQPGMDIVLKTTDLKIMAIEDGYSFEVRCRNDYEPVASLQDNEMTNDRYDTYELDYCRMTNPRITFEGGE